MAAVNGCFVRFVQPDGSVSSGQLTGGSVTVVADPFRGSEADGRPASGDTFSLSQVRLLPPSRPRLAIGVGRNFRTGAEPPAGDPPMFLKPVSGVSGPGDVIPLPTGSTRVIAEGEVVAVIGRELAHGTPSQAREAIFGVTAGNDVTAREWLRSPGDWWRAKGSDGFTAAGPAIVTGLDLDAVELTVRVNGVEVYRASTAGLVVDIASVVAFVSAYVTLRPGDWVFTGTPGPTAYLQDGDEVEVEVGGAGTLRNRFHRAEPAAGGSL
jgi:2-keto-4-pentenoate hydratase/2-oxohepta-3-ene-1,7-dioic acid hydratase in catechol pathway